MTPSVVFITNKSSTHEYSPAGKFGAIRFVTMGNYPIFKTRRLQEQIASVLVHSQPTDYLLLSGSSMIAALCLGIWLNIHKEARILMWDRSQNEYVMRVVSTEEIRLDVETAVDQLDPTRSTPNA